MRKVNFNEAVKIAKEGGLVSCINWNNAKVVFARPADKIDAETVSQKIKSLPTSFKDAIAADLDLLRTSNDAKGDENYEILFDEHLFSYDINERRVIPYFPQGSESYSEWVIIGD